MIFAFKLFFYIRLIFFPAPIRIFPTPSKIVVRPSGNAFLHCQAYGKPQPRITWTQDSQPIRSGGKFRVFENGTLIISQVGPEDMGDYMCQADNGVSTPAQRIMMLSLRGKSFTFISIMMLSLRGKSFTFISFMMLSLRGKGPVNIFYWGGWDQCISNYQFEKSICPFAFCTGPPPNRY